MTTNDTAKRIVKPLDANIYPIVIPKLLLNKFSILSFLKHAKNEDFKYKTTVSPDWDILLSDKGSYKYRLPIKRVFYENKNLLVLDKSTNCYLYKNEIFQQVAPNRVVIFYCPHPTSIYGEITNFKVRKIVKIVVEDNNLVLPLPKTIREIDLSEWMNKPLKCWFNKQFSLITYPNKRWVEFSLVVNT